MVLHAYATLWVIFLTIIAATVIAYVLIALQIAYGDPNENSGSRLNLFRGIKGSVVSKKNPDGPWPECQWMTGQECARYIQEQVLSVDNNVYIEFMLESETTMSLALMTGDNHNRIIILVDEFDAVLEPPGRGRRRRLF